jgi:hypothetical protein
MRFPPPGLAFTGINAGFEAALIIFDGSFILNFTFLRVCFGL